MLRKIVYIEPSTGRRFVFLTNQMTLPPGLIAFIYKKRWDIEKVFDQFKNKLMESKAWAKSLIAKCTQAQFMVLTHNLTLMLERKLESEKGICNTKIEKHRKKESYVIVGRSKKPEEKKIRLSPNPINPFRDHFNSSDGSGAHC